MAKIDFKKTAVMSTAAMIAVSAMSVSAMAAEFSDVAINDSYHDAISAISDLGIITGYEDGSFRPNVNISKAEMAVMIARMTPYDYFDSKQFPQYFKDVTDNYWAYPYIGKATQCGVFSTFFNTAYNDEYLGNTAATTPNIENDIFSPDSNVTYTDAVKAVITLLGYNGIAEKNGGYPNGYLFTGKVFGFTDNVREYKPEEYITRADFASIVNNALDIHWCISGSDEIENDLKNDNVSFIKYDGYIIYSELNVNTLRDIMNKYE
jgi:hypothetical protein